MVSAGTTLELMETEVDAVIRNCWRIAVTAEGHVRAVMYFGELVSDRRNRFLIGHRILTSTVVMEEGDRIRTLNSVYRIEGTLQSVSLSPAEWEVMRALRLSPSDWEMLRDQALVSIAAGRDQIH